MNISIVKVMIISSFYLVLVTYLADNVIAIKDECKEERCQKNGPSIRFPFRLRGRQPPRCGYPGFDLSCTSTNDTLLERPIIGVKLYVSKINYRLQRIQVRKMGKSCGPHKNDIKSFNNSIYPFQYSSDRSLIGSTLFNCSSNHRYNESYPRFGNLLSCLSDDRFSVYLTISIYEISLNLHELAGCQKMFDVLSVPEDLFNQYEGDFSLTWLKPNCSYCEAKGEICRLKKNSTDEEPRCVKLTAPHKGHDLENSIAVAVVGSLVLILTALAIFHHYKLDRKERESQLRIEKFLDDYKASKPSRYAYADIKRITNQFKEKLGQGAFGTVFKGKLSNEVLVAVKILNNFKGNGDDFINEVGTMGLIHHVNVVRLVGYCAEGFSRALIYEFLSNDSLEKYTSSASCTAKRSLSWEKLQDIALGIAKGMEYLHQGCDQRILHFDIKPHNILLDHNFKPKISDFGLAKLCSKDQSIVSMTATRGTIGYIAPEVFSKNFGNVSYKSDVYSFGMLLLEMVGGRKNSITTEENTDEIYYPEWIYSLLEEGRDLRIQIIEDEEDCKIAKKLAIVGLWCIQWHSVSRPTMKSVVHMLESGVEELTIPPNPFASASEPKTNPNRRARQLTFELEAIDE